VASQSRTQLSKACFLRKPHNVQKTHTQKAGKDHYLSEGRAQRLALERPGRTFRDDPVQSETNLMGGGERREWSV